MEKFYEDYKKKYKATRKTLLAQNTEMINSQNKPKGSALEVYFKRSKTIIQYIKPCPKCTFFTVTNLNIHTKDDPILRYIPSVKDHSNSSIAFFEGTVFETSPFDVRGFQDYLFLKHCLKEGFYDEGVKYLNSTFGREDRFEMAVNKLNIQMEEIFCSMCCVFNCGIHKYHNPKIRSMKETRSCFCRSLGSINKHSDKLVLDACPEMNPCLKFVISKLFCKAESQCSGGARGNYKSIKGNKKSAIQGQLYEPCVHKDSCSKTGKCPCCVNSILCEVYCGCTSCSNVTFCSCVKCDDRCTCLQKGRECTDMCGCESCFNIPIVQNLDKKSSITKSLKHGLGLFCEEFIPANTFVLQYTGEFISDKEAERRGNFYEMNHLSYLFNCVFNDVACFYSIDAFYLGNQSRFINHSVKDANLRSDILVSQGNSKVVFYSTRDIYKGEEFLFDYKFTDEFKAKHGIVD